MKKLKSILLVIVTIAMITSCKKGDDGAIGPIGPTGPKLTGSIIGYVELYNEFAGKSTDHSGVTVTIQDTTITATSEASGKFELKGVPTGTYNLIYTKSGYGTYKNLSIPHVGGKNPTFIYTLEMEQISTTVPSILTHTVSGNYIDINGTITPSGTTNERRAVIVFCSTKSDVSSTNYEYESEDYYLSSNTFGTEFNISRYPSGTTLYFIAYGVSGYITSYFDINTNSDVYPCVNPTPSAIYTYTKP